MNPTYTDPKKPETKTSFMAPEAVELLQFRAKDTLPGPRCNEHLCGPFKGQACVQPQPLGNTNGRRLCGEHVQDV